MTNNFNSANPIAPVKYGKLSFDKRYSPKQIASKSTVYAILIAITFMFILPYVWLVCSSFKDPSEFSGGFSLLPRDSDGNVRFVFSNYVNAWNELHIPQVLLNTLIVCVSNTILNLFLNSLAAYAFARIKFVGRDKMFMFSLTSMMVPGCVLLIPNFIIFKSLGLVNNLLGLILPFSMSVYNVFLLRQQFMAVEKEIEEAAFIDGAGYFTVFFKVCLPIVKPTLVVLSITTFMWNYNNYLWPLLIMLDGDESRYTLAFSLGNLMQTTATSEFPKVLAGAVMVSAPMIIAFFFLQKYIIGGTMAGAVKG